MNQDGRVIRIEPRVWTVELAADAESSVELPCSLKPKLFENLVGVKNPVAVGDFVKVRVEGERGVIDEVLPRRNRIARPLPSDPNTVQVTAANIDMLVSVSAMKDPPLRLGLIDRFQVAAERQDMEFVVVVNKSDRGRRERVDAMVSIYREMGYHVFFTSAKRGDGIDELAAHLVGKTSIFVGHSGVGKSSLLNRIDPDLQIRTSHVAKHGRGRHTTTSVALWRLPLGGFLVDSPGIRGFGLLDIPEPELAILMPDLRPFTKDCRFPDCTHDHEPDCAVIAAQQRGEIQAGRYESYTRMLASLRGETDDGEERS